MSEAGIVILAFWGGIILLMVLVFIIFIRNEGE